MIWITPKLNQWDHDIADGTISDPVTIDLIERAWLMVECPDTSDSVVYFALLEEIGKRIDDGHA